MQDDDFERWQRAAGHECDEVPRRRDDPEETIGELYDRLPAGQWVELPEYGIRVRRLTEESP